MPERRACLLRAPDTRRLRKLKQAGCTHVASIERLFLAHFTPAELEQLAGLLGRLPGARSTAAPAPSPERPLPPAAAPPPRVNQRCDRRCTTAASREDSCQINP